MPKIFSKFLGFLKNDQAANAKNEPINNVQPLQTVSTPIEQAPAQTKNEIVPIVWSDLSSDKVINRYLTTDHSTSPAQYDFYEYHKAEFDCILHNLEKVKITLSNEKVTRNKVILTPYEKTKNIIASTKLSKVKDFIAIDVETTGLKTGYNDIIEVSAIRFVDFKPIEIFTTLLKPRKPIPAEATAINGITDEMVADSPTFSQIHNSLKEFIGNSNLVMHNAKFDTKFLFVSGLNISEKQTIYCTLELSKKLLKDWDDSEYDSYKLADICDEVSIYFDGAHRSSADALATGLLFNEIVKRKKDEDNLLEALADEKKS